MRALGRRGGWTVLLAVVVMLGAGVASASAATAPLKVVLEFDGTGTFSATNQAGTEQPEHADVALKWSQTYAGDLQPDGSITFQATGAGAPGEVLQTPAPAVGTYHFTTNNALDTADCSGSLPAAPSPPDPVATYQGGTLTVQSITSVDQNNQTGQIHCPGIDQFGNAIDDSGEAANLAGAFENYLPDVLGARISLSADELKSGTVTKSVSSSDAVAQLPGSCADQFGVPEGQCPMSLSWSGTIKVSIPCGVITFSDGDAPPVGTLVNPGDIVSTGAKSRVEITQPDGGIVRLGPSSKMQCVSQASFEPGERSTPDTLKLLLGRMWGAIDDATGGHSYEVATERAGTGVRGCAFTASVQADGKILFHVIQGKGFIRVKGKPEVDFPSGEGLLLNPSSGAYTMTTAWPAADQALVPAKQQPPKLTGVRLTGTRAGRPPKLHLALNKKATVTVQIQRGKHRVLTRTASVRPGSRVLTLKALPKGRYTLTVFATVQKRSVAVQESFRVT